jgi:hypothetical protein
LRLPVLSSQVSVLCSTISFWVTKSTTIPLSSPSRKTRSKKTSSMCCAHLEASRIRSTSLWSESSITFTSTSLRYKWAHSASALIRGLSLRKWRLLQWMFRLIQSKSQSNQSWLLNRLVSKRIWPLKRQWIARHLPMHLMPITLTWI